jgi:CubicO group peptidase (beta-lactamase class C family)
MPARPPHQERFAPAFALLERGVRQRAFPGASVAVTLRGELVAARAVGRFTYDEAAPEVTPETIFDLASLTKVIATTPAAMILYERGELDLDVPVGAMIPEFGGGDLRRKSVTVRMLLLHSSGLPAYERLFERAANGDELMRLTMTIPLAADPDTRIEYSDIGFIVLGRILELLAGESLSAFCQREIFGPLGMPSTCYRPPESRRSEIPPTEEDRTFRHRIVQGEVNDENAWRMEGVAGHAGLFSNAGDVARLAREMLNGGKLWRRETSELFTRPVEIGGKRHALGWDIPTPPSQAGGCFSPESFGHLGFTGTSVWVDPDPERELTVTLLTNRTWPDRSSQLIRTLRPEFHDALMESV